MFEIMVSAPRAEACGGFFHHTLAPEQRPSLAREKVLIIHDAARGRQHFVREVAFRRATQPFGFVVPTPTRPEVAQVRTSPFSRLRANFPFEVMKVGAGYGRGAGGYGQRVEVLSVDKVGSFTAFVLAATDAAALAGWLKENHLTSTPETDRWLAHYVQMGFYYVAMRYDPPAAAPGPADDAIAAETIRISFDSPIAYYPYFEPELQREPEAERLLELWYVGSESVVPVARLGTPAEPDTRPRWVRPLMPGNALTRARESIEAALPDELDGLLPAGELVLQTFQDQKRRRTGYQDILFAYAEARRLSPEQEAALAPLLGVLDPALIKGGT